MFRGVERVLGELTEGTDGVQVGTKFVVQVGCDAFADQGFLPGAVQALVEQQEGNPYNQSGQSPEQPADVGFLLMVLVIQGQGERGEFDFQVVAAGELTQPLLGRQDVAIEVTAIGQAGG